MSSAFVVVDTQNDFAKPDGSLYVPGGEKVAHNVHDYIRDGRKRHKKFVATKDWHPRDGDCGGHFSDNPDFIDTWPRHCIASSWGAEFAGGLTGLMFDDIFHKGWGVPAYSGFEGVSVRNGTTGLHAYLSVYGILELYLVGIASTHCLLATALDGLDRGYKVNVLSSMTVGVDVDGTGQAHIDALALMKEKGAVIL